MPATRPSPTKRNPSVFQRWLEPLGATIWTLFLVWTVIILIVWLAGIGDVELAQSVKNPDLLKALQWLTLTGDAIWVLLAAANVYLSQAATDGLKTTRTRAIILLASAWGVCALSSRFGLPLGPLRYTGRLGVHLGPVPFGVPLLWYVVVNGARSTAMRLAPRVRHEMIAALTAVLAALTDLNIESIAWKHRVWWLWFPARIPAPSFPPVSNFGTWLLLSAILAFIFRDQEIAKKRPSNFGQPIVTFAILNAAFLLSHFLVN